MRKLPAEVVAQTRWGKQLFVLVIFAIVYGTTEETKTLAISTAVSSVSGFQTLEACQAAGARLVQSPRPSNLEIRFSCEAAG